MAAPELPPLRASRWRAPWHPVWIVGVVFVAYGAGAELSWGWFGATFGLAFFPPSGVTVAVLLWQGMRRWPWVVVGVVAAECAVDLQHGLGAGESLGYAAANSLEALVGAWVVVRLGRSGWWRGPARPDLSTRQGMGRFLVGAVGVGPLVGGLVGAAVKVQASSGSSWVSNTVHWWVGDGLGALVVGGAILVALGAGVPRSWSRRLELAAMLVLIGGASVLVLWVVDEPLDYLLLPLVWWAAFRFGVVGVAGAGVVLAGAANLATAHGHGPFTVLDDPSPQGRISLTQLYVAANVLAPWFFAIESKARAAAEARHRHEAVDRERAELDRDVADLAVHLAEGVDPAHVAARAAASVRRRLGADTVLVVGGLSTDGPTILGGSPEGHPLARVGEAWSHPGDDASAPKGAAAGDVVTVPLPSLGERSWFVVHRTGGAALDDSEQRFLARAAPLVVEAIERSRRLVVEHERTQRLRDVFDNVDQGFAVCEMVVDDAGRPVDYRFVEINPRFEEMTGLVDALGRTAMELVPDLEAVWVDMYARAAFGGEVLRFEQGSEAMSRWFEVFAMPLRSAGQFALVFRDQTDRHRAEEAVHRRQARAELMAAVLSELELVGNPDVQLDRLLDLLVPVLGDAAAFDAEADAHRAGAFEPGSGRLVVSFDAGAERRGALVVERSDPSRRPFDLDDYESLQEIAGRAEVVIASSRLRQQEHDISVRLQRALLPDRLAWHPNVLVEARYHAADALLQVGGDWYDTFAWPGGRLAVMVGDVVGHNLDSAATMGRLRAATAALALGTRSSPAALLEALERSAHGPGGTDFVTAACVVIDPVTGHLTYSSAGHPPVLLIRPDGVVQHLADAHTAPIGAAGRRPWREASVVMEPGSLVVLYSDGLIERRHRSLDEGLDTLVRSATDVVDLPVAAVADRIVADSAAQGPFEDDVVVACFRYTPEVARLRRSLPARADRLGPLRDEVRHWLVERRLERARQDDVLLAIAEACTNAIEHAYAGAEGTVEVAVGDHLHHLAVEVRDFGAWRHVRGRDRAGGRGTAIMKAVSSHFERVTDERGTTVTVIVPCAARVATSA